MLLLLQFVGFKQLSRNPSFLREVLRLQDLACPFHGPGICGFECFSRSFPQAVVTGGIAGYNSGDISRHVFSTYGTFHKGRGPGCGVCRVLHECETSREYHLEL